MNMNTLKVVGVKNTDSNINAAISTVTKVKSPNTNTSREVGSIIKNGGNKNAAVSTPSKEKNSKKVSPFRQRKYLYHKTSP